MTQHRLTPVASASESTTTVPAATAIRFHRMNLRAVGIEHEKMAQTLARTGDADRSRQFYSKAASVYNRLASTDPMNALARSDLKRISARIPGRP